MANTHSDFFQGQIDRGLFYWPSHSGKLEDEMTVSERKALIKVDELDNRIKMC
jgi:hypothetical protein